MKKVAVILSGCGYLDGSEVREAVLTLLALDEEGAEAHCLAPATLQKRVVDHVDQQASKDARLVLAESARIARGKIKDLRHAHASDYDAVILPGGYGAALNLSNFAEAGEAMQVERSLEEFLKECYRSGKPIGAICIAPVILAKLFGELKPELTIGSDPGTAAAMTKMGAKHVEAKASQSVVDRRHKLVTTPAYMYDDARLADVAKGIRSLVKDVLSF